MRQQFYCFNECSNEKSDYCVRSTIESCVDGATHLINFDCANLGRRDDKEWVGID